MRNQSLSPPKCPAKTPLVVRGVICAAIVLVTACSSGNKGMPCHGRMETLSGEPKGLVEGTIIDRFTSFRVNMPDVTLESGPLHSNDRQRYLPSAVTREGWLAQRLSDTRFSVINAPQDKMIVFSCPARAI